MKAVSSEEMKFLEEFAIKKIGIPSLSLMETASSKVAERCLYYIRNNECSNVLVFAGKGNNGGDGLAVCRHLYQKNDYKRNIEIEVVFVGDPERASEECKTQLNILENMNVKGFPFIIHMLEYEKNLDLKPIVEKADLVVDAIIGTGLKSELKENICGIVECINKYAKKVVSVDCPTGIDSDKGRILGAAVKADVTVTFHLPKIGLLINKGAEYAGELFIEDIYIPFGLENELLVNVLTDYDAKFIIPKRKRNTNKGSFGKVFIFAGCSEMTGACIIASKAAYRAGAGLVCACSVKEVCDAVHYSLPEVVTKILKGKNGMLYEESIESDIFKSADIIGVGPGIGRGKGIFQFMKKLIENAEAPLIIDADGLNAISENLDILLNLKQTAIITPHIGEMSRLTGISPDEIKNDVINIARNFAQKYNVIVVLKDARTVIASPDGKVYINTTGCSALAKGGSGDCLTGIIAAIAAQGKELFDSAVLGAYVLGKAGEKAADEKGEYGVLARDTADYVSFVLSSCVK